MPGPKGEQLVAYYLRERGLPFARERLVDTRRPDFSVDHPDGTFVMEVYDPYAPFDLNHSGAVAYQEFPRAFQDRKLEQIRATARAGLPYVGVLGPGQAQVELDAFALAQSMFGTAGVTTVVGPERSRNAMQAGFFATDNSHISPVLNTAVSAMAIVKPYNPTRPRLLAALKEKWSGVDLAALSDEEFKSALAAPFGVDTEIEHEMIRAGTYDPDARIARLVVVHNPWADRPLPYDRLGGRFDRQIGRHPTEGPVQFAEVALGRDVPRDPWT